MVAVRMRAVPLATVVAVAYFGSVAHAHEEEEEIDLSGLLGGLLGGFGELSGDEAEQANGVLRDLQNGGDSDEIDYTLEDDENLHTLAGQTAEQSGSAEERKKVHVTGEGTGLGPGFSAKKGQGIEMQTLKPLEFNGGSAEVAKYITFTGPNALGELVVDEVDGIFAQQYDVQQGDVLHAVRFWDESGEAELVHVSAIEQLNALLDAVPVPNELHFKRVASVGPAIGVNGGNTFAIGGEESGAGEGSIAALAQMVGGEKAAGMASEGMAAFNSMTSMKEFFSLSAKEKDATIGGIPANKMFKPMAYLGALYLFQKLGWLKPENFPGFALAIFSTYLPRVAPVLRKMMPSYVKSMAAGTLGGFYVNQEVTYKEQTCVIEAIEFMQPESKSLGEKISSVAGDMSGMMGDGLQGMLGGRLGNAVKKMDMEEGKAAVEEFATGNAVGGAMKAYSLARDALSGKELPKDTYVKLVCNRGDADETVHNLKQSTALSLLKPKEGKEGVLKGIKSSANKMLKQRAPLLAAALQNFSPLDRAVGATSADSAQNLMQVLGFGIAAYAAKQPKFNNGNKKSMMRALFALGWANFTGVDKLLVSQHGNFTSGLATFLQTLHVKGTKRGTAVVRSTLKVCARAVDAVSGNNLSRFIYNHLPILSEKARDDRKHMHAQGYVKDSLLARALDRCWMPNVVKKSSFIGALIAPSEADMFRKDIDRELLLEYKRGSGSRFESGTPVALRTRIHMEPPQVEEGEPACEPLAWLQNGSIVSWKQDSGDDAVSEGEIVAIDHTRETAEVKSFAGKGSIETVKFEKLALVWQPVSGKALSHRQLSDDSLQVLVEWHKHYYVQEDGKKVLKTARWQEYVLANELRPIFGAFRRLTNKGHKLVHKALLSRVKRSFGSCNAVINPEKVGEAQLKKIQLALANGWRQKKGLLALKQGDRKKQDVGRQDEPALKKPQKKRTAKKKTGKVEEVNPQDSTNSKKAEPSGCRKFFCCGG